MPDIQKKLPPQTGKFGISERFGDTNNQLSVASFSGKQKSVRKKTKPPGLLHNLEGKPDVSALLRSSLITKPWAQLSGEVSQIFIQCVSGPPTLTNIK